MRAPQPERRDLSQAGRGGEAAARHRSAHVAYWDEIARVTDRRPGLGGAYHRRLHEVYRFLVPPGLRVLEVGCGRGDLLAALEPAFGVGVDFSVAMVARAARRHPSLELVVADAHGLGVKGPFDVVILSDLINGLWDVQGTLEQVLPLCTSRTRVIVNTYSHLWDCPLTVAKHLGLARPMLEQSWLTVSDVRNMLTLAGFDSLRWWQEVLWPLPLPLLGPFVNRFLTKVWPTRHLALTNFVLARPVPSAVRPRRVKPSVSVVVPARNEAGNIAEILARVPEMGAGTELVFVEGHSTDDTYATIERLVAERPQRRCQVLRQTGKGKGDAVRLGFERARGDVLMILDADLTVPPEELPRFLAALTSGRGDFVNGVRLVYPMQDMAMRPLNLIGNKFFSLAFSWLLGQLVKDTLCGTKVLWAEDYRLIAANRDYFGDIDPFGDFDLLFGAAKLGLKIVDLPVRYRERTYGTTNISRFRHGLLLLQMVGRAALRLKFV